MWRDTPLLLAGATLTTGKCLNQEDGKDEIVWGTAREGGPARAISGDLMHSHTQEVRLHRRQGQQQRANRLAAGSALPMASCCGRGSDFLQQSAALPDGPHFWCPPLQHAIWARSGVMAPATHGASADVTTPAMTISATMPLLKLASRQLSTPFLAPCQTFHVPGDHHGLNER